MAKDAIRKTIRDLGNALGFKTLRLEGNSVVIDAGEFITYAIAQRNGNGDDEESEDEESEGPRKPLKKITTDLIRKVISDLGGKATSAEIRTHLKDEQNITANAADIRPALQALQEEGEINTSGQARALTYNLRKPKK